MLACNYPGPTAEKEWEEGESSPRDKDVSGLQWDGKTARRESLCS